MRILFKNETITASLSVLYENAQYPVTNLNHVFLKKIFKSTQNSDVITILFPSAIPINSIYVGLTNAISITLRLYNVSSTLIDTKVVDTDKFSAVFTSIPSVKYVTVTFSASAPVYVGTIGIGQNFIMPDPINDVVKGFIDNSIEADSLDGQTMMNKIEWLRSVKSSHFVYDIDEYNEIYEQFSGISRPVWVDYFENTTNTINPVYGKTRLSSPSKNDRLYSFKIETAEAR